MIRKSNEIDRRILTFPAVHPCEDVSLPTLITSLFTLSRRICSFKSKVFSSNKKNARKAIRMIEVLQIFLEEIRDRRWSSPDSVILSLSELHLTFQKLQFLLEDCTLEGSRLYMLMESDRVATHFQVLSRSVVTALDILPFSSIEISEVTEQVELILQQARKFDFEVEPEDKRAMMGVLSILNQFENSITPSESDLRLILGHIGVRRWSECNKEIKFLDTEIGHERMKEDKRKLARLSGLMGFMSYCRCVEIEVVDDGEDDPNSDYRKESEIIQTWCFNPDDFRCPISLEIMNDPVTIETGHTYDRSSILKWFSSGSLICPKTGRNLSSIELIPNLVLRRLIHQYCSKNGILVAADLGRRNRDRDNKTTFEPGSLAAQEAMKMLASFLSDQLQSEAEFERNRAAYEIRVLSKRNIFNRSCFVESGTITYLLRLLSSSRNPTTQENAIASLMNLSRDPKSRNIMVLNGGLELIVSVCKKGMKLESRHHAAATLYYLASDEENRMLIGQEPEAIPCLINLLKEGSDRGKKNGLVALYGLLFHSENHKRVLEARAIPLLVSILKTCEREELVTDSLAVLAILAEKSAGAMAILQNGALHPTMEILNSSSTTSRIGKEQCVSLLLSLAVNGGANVVALLVKSPSLMGSLYSLLSEGTFRASKKASALIRVLHDFCERRPFGFKSSSVLPQEQFIHVW